MDAAGIGEDDVRFFENVQKLIIVQRLTENNSALMGKNGNNGFAHKGVGMHRKEDIHLWMALRDILDRQSHRTHGQAEIFSAMTGDKNELARAIHETTWKTARLEPIDHPMERIHHRVAGNVNGIFRDIFFS